MVSISSKTILKSFKFGVLALQSWRSLSTNGRVHNYTQTMLFKIFANEDLKNQNKQIPSHKNDVAHINFWSLWRKFENHRDPKLYSGINDDKEC